MRHQYSIIFIIIISVISCKKSIEYERKSINPIIAPPPKNNYLANSSWPITHANSYAQASVNFSAPITTTAIRKDYKNASPGTITMAISSEYPNGNRVIWYGNNTHIIKAIDTGDGFQIIAKKEKEDNQSGSIFSVETGLSGAYTFVDKDYTFYSPRKTSIYAYSDAIRFDENSAITLLRSYTIPTSLITPNDKIVGMNLTYDGYICFATNNGLIGVLSRDFSTAYYHQLINEEVSNSIACDEDNGIYVVTSKYMHRLQWTGTRLSANIEDGAWSAEYETGSGNGGIRLGLGSGSTPTLMGHQETDKYVVITDGQELMNLVVFWRDKIPSDWQQISGTKDRRIAGQIPVTFGNKNATKSLSEQSVCISGYEILVVNNEIKGGTDNRTLDLLLSGVPQNAPYGAEKFEWNVIDRKLYSIWANTKVSFPNGIPCMSTTTNLAYCVGQQNGIWNFTALDWTTGQTKFIIPFSNNIKFNSAYASTQIGINGGLYSGALFGVMGVW